MWGRKGREKELTVASSEPSPCLSPEAESSVPSLSSHQRSTSSFPFSRTFLHTPSSPPHLIPISVPLPPLGPGPLPALSLTPMFANHFFPCQQVNCFVLPFPAFITLCKLSDMSSTGARQSTHRANAKIMRFGIINEDKLAVAVLLSARARLHYSLNLPEKMT